MIDPAALDDTSDDLITPEEAARILRVSRGSAYDLARRGVIPAFRIGRKLKVHRGQLLAWIAAQAAERAQIETVES